MCCDPQKEQPAAVPGEEPNHVICQVGAARATRRCCGSFWLGLIVLVQVIGLILAATVSTPWVIARRSTYIGGGQNLTTAAAYDISGTLIVFGGRPAYGTCLEAVNPSAPWMSISSSKYSSQCPDGDWANYRNSNASSVALDLRTVGAKASDTTSASYLRVVVGILAGMVATVLLAMQGEHLCLCKESRAAVSADASLRRRRTFFTIFCLLFSTTCFYVAYDRFRSIIDPIYRLQSEYYTPSHMDTGGSYRAPVDAPIYGYDIRSGPGAICVLVGGIMTTIVLAFYLFFFLTCCSPRALFCAHARVISPVAGVVTVRSFPGPDPRLEAFGYAYDAQGRPLAVPVAASAYGAGQQWQQGPPVQGQWQQPSQQGQQSPAYAYPGGAPVPSASYAYGGPQQGGYAYPTVALPQGGAQGGYAYPAMPQGGAQGGGYAYDAQGRPLAPQGGAEGQGGYAYGGPQQGGGYAYPTVALPQGGAQGGYAYPAMPQGGRPSAGYGAKSLD
jgi:hypothetical protein